jgi:hypothetical protein
MRYRSQSTRVVNHCFYRIYERLTPNTMHLCGQTTVFDEIPNSNTSKQSYVHFEGGFELPNTPKVCDVTKKNEMSNYYYYYYYYY